MGWLSIAANVGTFISALAAAGAIVVALRAYRRQINAQLFLDFTGRYHALMESFPESARKARLNVEGELPEASEALQIAVLRYLNLCSEEFYLQHRGYLARDVWRIWEAELRRTLASPLLRREWQTLKDEFVSYPEFAAYVTSVQGQALAPKQVKTALKRSAVPAT